MKILNILFCSVIDNPHTYIRQLEINIKVPKLSVQRILHQFKYRQYKLHVSQEVQDSDLGEYCFVIDS